MNIPIATRSKQYFDELPAGDDPAASLFPDVYARRVSNKTSGITSAQFRKIMVKAELVEDKNHQSTGKGRGAKREVSKLSFYCLRHTAISMLKNTTTNTKCTSNLTFTAIRIPKSTESCRLLVIKENSR